MGISKQAIEVPSFLVKAFISRLEVILAILASQIKSSCILG